MRPLKADDFRRVFVIYIVIIRVILLSSSPARGANNIDGRLLPFLGHISIEGLLFV